MTTPDQHTEKRRDDRYGYHSPIIRENLDTGMILIGRMHNYSRGGFSFESNAALKAGDIAVLGISESPYPRDAPLHESHRVKIRWRKDFHHSRYRYLYGVQHLDPIGSEPEIIERYYCDIPEYLNLISGMSPEMRKFERKRLSTAVYFTTRQRLFKGLLRDVSRSGLFIETRGRLAVGGFIRLVVPGTKFDNRFMLRGRVVHTTVSGFGVRLLGIQKM
ncbi:MAG: PilZ domain-containing protein [Desulfobacterales bacterium]